MLEVAPANHVLGVVDRRERDGHGVRSIRDDDGPHARLRDRRREQQNPEHDHRHAQAPPGGASEHS